MKRVLVIGCSGSGKSTFARALQEKTGLPLYHLDQYWHRADRTTVTREEFRARLEELLSRERWILDGMFLRTLELRLRFCDTVFFLDYPLDVCIRGIESRIGKPRADMPWVEMEFDPAFRTWVESFPEVNRPKILALLERFRDKCQIISFFSRQEAQAYLDRLTIPGECP